MLRDLHIRYADTHDSVELAALWTDVFGDTATYVDHVMTSWSRHNGILVATDGHDRPVAMLHTRLMHFQNDDGLPPLRGKYIYGCATRPDRRGEGIMRRLIMEATMEADRHKADFMFLVPASESLRGWYRRQGFTSGAKRRHVMMPWRLTGKPASRRSTVANLSFYVKMNTARLPYGSMLPSGREVAAALREWELSGGAVVQDGSNFAMVSADGSSVGLWRAPDLEALGRLIGAVHDPESHMAVLLSPSLRGRVVRGIHFSPDTPTATEPYAMVRPFSQDLRSRSILPYMLMD